MTAYDSACLPMGTRLDAHYVISGLLGRGGFAITYIVRDEILDQEFALKEFFPDELVRRDDGSTRVIVRTQRANDFSWSRKKFFDEARVLAQFNHPNIVGVRRVFESNDTAYMLLELVRGITFEAWLKGLDSPPTQTELDLVAAPLLSALDLVHTNRTWHLDISPDNIMIRSADGSPVLLDFGASRLELKQHSQLVSALVFKSGYSAPEQYTSKADQYGAWTDIYAFGATLYRAVTGVRPSEATARQLTDDLVPAAERARGVYRKSFLDAIDAALRLSPARRPQSISEWSRSLLEGSSVSNRLVPTRVVPVREEAERPPPLPVASPKVPVRAKSEAKPRWQPGLFRVSSVIGLVAIAALTLGSELYSGRISLPWSLPWEKKSDSSTAPAEQHGDAEADRKAREQAAQQRLDELKRMWSHEDAERKAAEEERKRQEAIQSRYTPNAECRQLEATWDDKPLARSLAVAENGHCVLSHGYRTANDAEAEAIRSCSSQYGGECRTLRTSGGDWTPRDTCNQWQSTPAIRALAVAQNGMCGWGSGYASVAEAKRGAIDACEKVGEKCRITEIFEGDWSLDDACQTSYNKWSRMRRRGAFAVAQGGQCGFSYGYPNLGAARSRALQECAQRGQNCKVIATR